MLNLFFAFVMYKNYSGLIVSLFVSRRHRQLSPGASPYVVLMETIKINPTNAEMQLVNTETNVRLLLSVYALKDNMARLKINELEPIRTRYEIPVGDVLVGEPKEQE